MSNNDFYVFRIDDGDHSKLTMILLLSIGVKFEIETSHEIGQLSPGGDYHAKTVSIIKIKKEDIDGLNINLETLNPNRDHSHARA